MNTNKPVPAEMQMPEEKFQASKLDPFDEPRTIPAGWDVSELLAPSLPPPNNHRSLEINSASSPNPTNERATTGADAIPGLQQLDCRFLDVFFYPVHRETFSPF